MEKLQTLQNACGRRYTDRDATKFSLGFLQTRTAEQSSDLPRLQRAKRSTGSRTLRAPPLRLKESVYGRNFSGEVLQALCVGCHAAASFYTLTGVMGHLFCCIKKHPERAAKAAPPCS